MVRMLIAYLLIFFINTAALSKNEYFVAYISCFKNKFQPIAL